MPQRERLMPHNVGNEYKRRFTLMHPWVRDLATGAYLDADPTIMTGAAGR